MQPLTLTFKSALPSAPQRHSHRPDAAKAQALYKVHETEFKSLFASAPPSTLTLKSALPPSASRYNSHRLDVEKHGGATTSHLPPPFYAATAEDGWNALNGGSSPLSWHINANRFPEAWKYHTDRSFKIGVTDNGVNGMATTEDSRNALNGGSSPLPWHINAMHFPAAWKDYTGRDLKIGVIDNGVNSKHDSLRDRIDTKDGYDVTEGVNDGSPKNAQDRHGTAVAGIIVAKNDGSSGVEGAAADAEVISYRMSYDDILPDSNLQELFNRQKAVSISNNSWAFTEAFSDNFSGEYVKTGAALQDAATEGRGGLGTIFVFAAGNGRQEGDNTNYHNLQNSPFVIAVGATDKNGHTADFSSPGASLLTSAPGTDIRTTDIPGVGGYEAGDYTVMEGTSFAAPQITSLVALMLQANPGLTVTDVQQILAYASVKPSDGGGTKWLTNGGHSFNGGGMHFSHEMGFGQADARAAVRLAESMTPGSTTRTSKSESATNLNKAIPDGAPEGVASVIQTTENGTLVTAEAHVSITHAQIGDLRITLTSPEGTESVLLDRPGKSEGHELGSYEDNIDFTFMTRAVMGENAKGAWKLTVSDLSGGAAGTLNHWDLTLRTSAPTDNDTYVYTDEYTRSAPPEEADARATIHDKEGTDVINASAVTSSMRLSLTPGTESAIGTAKLNIDRDSLIENAVAGDGDDELKGNQADNRLQAGRGNDVVSGGLGNDSLNGGAGEDVAVYNGKYNDFLIAAVGENQFRLTDLVKQDGDEGTDLIEQFERFRFAGREYIYKDGKFIAETPGTPPVANDDNLQTGYKETTAFDVLANDRDAEDGETLKITRIVTPPAHGKAVIDDHGKIVYTPDEGFIGKDLFVYEVVDSDGQTDQAEAAVTVNPPKELPEHDLPEDPKPDPTPPETETPVLPPEEGPGHEAPPVKHPVTAHDGTAEGSEGDDVLQAGDTRTTMYGFGGNDELRGGHEEDQMTGGEGADRFVFGKGEIGYDAIYDFSPEDKLIFEEFGDGKSPLDHTTYAPGYAFIDLGERGGITLYGLHQGDLHADMFVY